MHVDDERFSRYRRTRIFPAWRTRHCHSYASFSSPNLFDSHVYVHRSAKSRSSVFPRCAFPWWLSSYGTPWNRTRPRFIPLCDCMLSTSSHTGWKGSGVIWCATDWQPIPDAAGDDPSSVSEFFLRSLVEFCSLWIIVMTTQSLGRPRQRGCLKDHCYVPLRLSYNGSTRVLHKFSHISLAKCPKTYEFVLILTNYAKL